MDFPGTLSIGARGEAVRWVQGRLNASGAAVTTDGHFGPLTRDAVETFQRAHSLVPTGVIASETWQALRGPQTAAAGIVIAGQRVSVPGVDVVTWLDDPKRAPPVTDGYRRRGPVLAVVLHTSRGVRGTVRPGARPSSRAETLALYQTRTDRAVSWDFTVDTDGTTLQQSDPAKWVCYHASEANGWTCGIEMVQHPDTGDLWQAQIDATVALVGALCDALTIPRRVIVSATGEPMLGQVKAIQSRNEGGLQGSWAGVIGHHHLTRNKGPGDPGVDIFRALLAAGYAGVAL